MSVIEEDRSEEEVVGYSRISCPCGFEVVGQDELRNLEALSAHDCPNGEGERWYHAVFSIWTVFIVGLITYALIEIFK